MNFISGAALAEGLAAMSVNRLRTALSTLGVVMGIASVIATLALADGLEQYTRSRIAAQTDVQSIAVSSKTQEIRDGFSFPNSKYPTFGVRDADDLRAFLGSHIDVTMSVTGEAIVTTPTAPAHAASVKATLANYLLFGMRDVLAGRYFSEVEVARNAPVVVLSYKLARELSPDGRAETMTGRDVRVHGRTMTIVGVMPAYTGETNYEIFIPLRAAATVMGVREGLTPLLFVRAPSVEEVDATEQRVIEWLAARYRDWDRQVSVATSLAQLEQVRSALVVLKLVMVAFASISLAVGGVGIMNVLLASVVERTREIGVRKALGARRRDILSQFLAESVAIASVGTGLGTVIGFTLAFSVAAVVRWRVPGAQLRAAVTSATILISIVSAAGVGLLFGTFPALRAAGLSPIDAIRHE
ncbi:MAG TPA: ABC transporter permease [Gemmatimonadaceae bacterium]